MTEKQDIIYILPLGAHEYHGMHLPLETDSIIAQSFSQKLQERFYPQKDLRSFPLETIGYSIEHMDREGTKTLSYQEAVERWISIIERQYEKGTKKFLILNAHGGNSTLMSVVATELRARLPILVAITGWGRFGLPEGMMSCEEKHLDIHGGFIETSLMLYLAPELVQMDKAENFTNRQETYIKTYKYLRAYGPFSFGWKMSDLNSKGAVGNALKANKDAGKMIFEHALAGLSDLVKDIARFDIHELH